MSFCAPAQAVAFASWSSLAALPVMVERAERADLPPAASRFIIPLAASVFRVGAAVAMPVGVLFLARLYGMTLSPAQLVSVVFATILSSFAVPGVPGGSIIAMVPVLAAANLPIDGIGIRLAVDTISDMFRTTENATGTMTLAAALNAQRSSLTSRLERGTLSLETRRAAGEPRRPAAEDPCRSSRRELAQSRRQA